MRPRILSYEGPFGVGYMVAAIDVAESVRESEEAERAGIDGDMRRHEPKHPFVSCEADGGTLRPRRHSLLRRSSRRNASSNDEGQPRAASSFRSRSGAICAAASAPSKRRRRNVGMEIVHNADRRVQSRPALPAGD